MTGAPLFCVRPPGWLGADATGAAARILAWVERAEALGFDGVFVGDRLLDSASMRDGRPVYGASMLEATTLLAAIAARTRTMLLGPLVMVLPFRHPVQLAKALSSLDAIADGRLVLGAGLGWSGRELDLLGIGSGERPGRFEESLELMRRLWAGESVSHEGRFWTLEDVRVTPVPARAGGPPVWIASFSPDQAHDWRGEPPASAHRVLRRAGRLADGWVPLVYSASARRRIDPAVLGRAWELVLEAAGDAGRTRADIDFVFSDWGFIAGDEAGRRRCRAGLERFFGGDWDDALRTYTIGSADEVVERLRADARHVDRVDAYVFTPLSDDPEQLDALAEGVVPHLRGDDAGREGGGSRSRGSDC